MSDRVDQTRAIKVGDTVAYSQAFLWRTGQYTGDAPRARGKVTALKSLGNAVTLAEIDWDGPDLPARVNVRILTTIKGDARGE